MCNLREALPRIRRSERRRATGHGRAVRGVAGLRVERGSTLREAVWSWLGAKSGTSEEVRTAALLSLETLEPRLLLSADLIGSQSPMSLETPLPGPAILVDVTWADEGQLESPSAILTINVLAVDQTGDTGTTGSDGLLTDNDPDDCVDQLADNMLGTDAGDRPVDENMTASWAAAIGQRACDVVTMVQPSTLPTALQNGSAGTGSSSTGYRTRSQGSAY